jgi:hypothetical protein
MDVALLVVVASGSCASPHRYGQGAGVGGSRQCVTDLRCGTVCTASCSV